MKIYVVVAVSTLALSSVTAVSDREVSLSAELEVTERPSHRSRALVASTSTSFVSSLKKPPNSDKYHTKSVRVIQARVQSDAPIWNETTKTFGSKYYNTAEEQFRGALDTVNTASVEGALMYVQAEGINYNTRSEEDRCWRKNGMQYVVFYDIVFAQTNETVAEYESEYGPMLPMDGGQCTPISGTNVFSKECVSLNGNASVLNLGPFIGGESKETDARAPYPHCWWYSFPNNCPLQKWANKTEECRASTRQGLCDMDTLPDGISCTYNYRILGYVPIDDAVGITAMTNKATGEKYANFTEFCEVGGVEFQASEAGVWNASIPFWKNPQNATANAARTKKLLSAYANLLKTNKSTATGCAPPPENFTFPTLQKTAALTAVGRIERFFVQQPPRARSSSFLTSLAARSSVLRRSSSSVSKASGGEVATAESMSHLERLKDLWRKYGIVAIGTYLTMYGAVLGSMYLAIDQGWVRTNKRTTSKGEGQSDESFNLVTTTNKFVKIAEDLGIAQYLEVEQVSSKTGTFLLAWIATKFTEPLRLALTIAVTPRIARLLGRAPKLPPKAPGKIASMIKKQTAPKEKPKA
ncbi:hypothetical protein JG688_00003401 [Phytophthora aleatoria]|uniref:DUF1279 domain-containing protein n=1 Tax=Phytophthora aleatoria TaxID=2496075 RepID=A0A8J5J1X2_9STRA|nr:hypothetical protein JG688_00003401 [Phytophthora aleatoria]